MNNLTPLILTSIAGFSTMLGNLLLFVNLKYKDKLISFSLGLSFIVMFLISILELVPEGLSLIYGSMPNIYLFILAFILLSIGYLIIVGIEKNINNNDGLYRIGILSMISLLLHNIPEGIICSFSSSINLDFGLKMTLLIMMHNIPEGICISLPIYYSTKSRGKALLYCFISSLGELVGALFTMIFLTNYINSFVLSIVFIVTAGIMISLSILKILKEGLSYKCYKWLILGILLGILIIYLTL